MTGTCYIPGDESCKRCADGYVYNGVKQNVNHEGVIDSVQVDMNPVYGKDGSENATWSKWTPAGSLTLHITNPNLFGIVPGTEYVVTFSPAEPAS